MKQIIEESMTDQDYNEALIDITEFKLGLLNRFTVDDLYILEESGFPFVSKSLTQRKQELRAFVCGHPAVMSGDFDMMLDKIMYYLSKQRKERLKDRQKRQMKAKAIKERYFKDYSDSEQDVPEYAKNQSSQSKKKRSRKPKVEPEQEEQDDNWFS